MPDIFSKEKRSQIMSKIRGRNTGIEKKLLKAMHASGIKGFEYQKRMLGNPDFVFEKQKIAVFCDGDFWHGYNFKKWSRKLNKFWFDKISRNIKRDREVAKQLKKEGWKVVRIWGHHIKGDPEKCLNKIIMVLK